MKRLLLGVALVFPVILAVSQAAQQAPAAVAIDNDDIGGVVTGPNGPEAGVWVIAETRDLPVRYIKSVVTDDRGRFVVPDLPKANYTVWARGYGLVDSAKATTAPGRQLNITARAAATPAEAAEYYPAIYWSSMLNIPAASEFNGTTPGIAKDVTQIEWLNAMKNNGCIGCHQLGQKSTRTIPASLGTFASHGAGVDTARAVGPGRPADERPAVAARRDERQEFRRLDRIASPRASCPTRSRNVRRASSATSSSRCATG